MTLDRSHLTAKHRRVMHGTVLSAGARELISLLPLVIVATMILTTAALSAPVITHQGYLTTDQGAPLPGPVDLTFGIYAAVTGGSPLWSEVHSGVPLANGTYTVLLGSVTAFPGSLFASDSLWIQTSVDGTSLPRRIIGDAPRAIEAAHAAVADSVAGYSGVPGQYWSAQGNNIYNTNSGNVGIGTANPTARLEVEGLTTFHRDDWGSITVVLRGQKSGPPNNWGEYGIVASYQGIDFKNTQTAANLLHLGAGGGTSSNSYTLQGNFGIGTDAPDGKLTVDTPAAAGSFFQNPASNDGYAGGTMLTIRNSSPATTNTYLSMVADYDGDNGGAKAFGALGLGTSSSLVLYNPSGAVILQPPGLGNVGIGTDGTPGSKLTVAGNTMISGVASVASLEIRGGADLAEPFAIQKCETGTKAEAGMVVRIDDEAPGHLRVSTTAYDRRVAGVISGAKGLAPGVVLKGAGPDGAEDLPVALSGRVWCRCDASNGAIRPGDLLTSSAKPGHAMKVEDLARAQGATLGKAMTGLEAGQGMVLVLVTLQ